MRNIEQVYEKVSEKSHKQSNINEKFKKDNFLKYELISEYYDKKKWKQLVSFIKVESNKKVKNILIKRFETIIAVQNQKRDFAINDIQIKINNFKTDFDITLKNRLAFLIEQAAIARKLNIKGNTVASQRFNSQNSLVTNDKTYTDTAYYLRGFKAINEEIKQIKKRKYKKDFIEDLYDLPSNERTPEVRTFKRAFALFRKTPLNQNDFQATIVKVDTTNFEKGVFI